MCQLKLTRSLGRNFITHQDLNNVDDDGVLLFERKSLKDIQDPTNRKALDPSNRKDLQEGSILFNMFNSIIGGMDRNIYDRSPSNIVPLPKKMKKKTLEYADRFSSLTYPEPILLHFPPMPPEHSYLTTKVISFCTKELTLAR